MTKRLSWAVRLERAEKRGKFTSYEKLIAESFATCAIGEKHNFDGTWIPWDESNIEHRLGMEFYAALKDNNILEAKRIYAEIRALP